MQPQQVAYPQQPAYPQPGAYPQQGAYPQAAYPQPQGQVIQGTPGQTIVIQTVTPRVVNRVYESYPAKASQFFGWTQLGIGITLIILNIVAICIDAYLAEVGHGIWCGIFFILTGSFGIAAGRSRTLCPIVAFMVLSILASLVAINVIGFGAGGASCDAHQEDCYCWGYDWDYDWDDCRVPDTSQSARVGVGATMALLGGIEGIVAIISSVLCCMGVCCGRATSSGAVISTSVPNTQVVTASSQMVYVPQVQAGMATVPQPQPQPQAMAIAPAGPSAPAYDSSPPPDYTALVDEKPRI